MRNEEREHSCVLHTDCDRLLTESWPSEQFIQMEYEVVQPVRSSLRFERSDYFHLHGKSLS
jgi:hypothetical protein